MTYEETIADVLERVYTSDGWELTGGGALRRPGSDYPMDEHGGPWECPLTAMTGLDCSDAPTIFLEPVPGLYVDGIYDELASRDIMAAADNHAAAQELPGDRKRLILLRVKLLRAAGLEVS